jgi:hypothetical protein
LKLQELLEETIELFSGEHSEKLINFSLKSLNKLKTYSTPFSIIPIVNYLAGRKANKEK